MTDLAKGFTEKRLREALEKLREWAMEVRRREGLSQDPEGYSEAMNLAFEAANLPKTQAELQAEALLEVLREAYSSNDCIPEYLNKLVEKAMAMGLK